MPNDTFWTGAIIDHPISIDIKSIAQLITTSIITDRTNDNFCAFILWRIKRQFQGGYFVRDEDAMLHDHFTSIPISHPTTHGASAGLAKGIALLCGRTLSLELTVSIHIPIEYQAISTRV